MNLILYLVAVDQSVDLISRCWVTSGDDCAPEQELLQNPSITVLFKKWKLIFNLCFLDYHICANAYFIDLQLELYPVIQLQVDAFSEQDASYERNGNNSQLNWRPKKTKREVTIPRMTSGNM